MDGKDHLNRTQGYRYHQRKLNGQYITIFDGELSPIQVNLDEYNKKEITFGRANNQLLPDIILNTKVVSRPHGRFIQENGKWLIEDFPNSVNGILYNDAYIDKKEIADGDIFRIDSQTDYREDGVMMVVSADSVEQSWQTLPLNKERIVIGRSEECDVRLSHIGVSRIHAVIEKKEGRWILTDQKSSNGTLVNGCLIRGEVPLHEKDVISIINARIIFTSAHLYLNIQKKGISVEARDIVIKRGNGKKQIITSDHVSMNIMPGELISIIGGSGAGKSTILNVLCGYLPPNEGSVYINGIDLYRNFEAMKKIFGYVPQSDIVYDNLTLYDMLKYTAKLRLPKDTSTKERSRAIEKAIKMVGLEDKRDCLIKSLSGGQRKRASIAVELVPDPQLLFLDEPASGLDPGTERELMLALRKMADDGKTIILVTHSTLQLAICDKIAFMGKGGRLCYFGNIQSALSFFEVSDVVDVYSKINNHSPEWQNKFNQYLSEVEEKKTKKHITVKKEKTRLRQFNVLFTRYGKLLLNDRQRLLLILLQAPLLAILISLVADGKQFHQYEMTNSLLFALSCCGFWIGMLNSIQEICKEKTILKREYMTGLSLSAYVFSKIFILGLLCLIQSCLVIGVFAWLVGLPANGLILPAFLEMYVTMVFTTLSSAAMGLFVSSLFSNPDRAMTVAPLLLMPQMLFSGLLFKLSGMTEAVSWITVCRWSMEGFGTTANLNNLQLQLQEEGLPVPHEPSDFFLQTNEHLLRAWCIMLIFIIVYLITARLILPRIKKEAK